MSLNKIKSQWVSICSKDTGKCTINRTIDSVDIPEDMFLGKPFRTMATGEVIHPLTGKRADIKRPMAVKDLEEFSRMFAGQKESTPVIIDWNHGSSHGGSPEESSSLGIIVDMWVEDLDDERGPGLYVLPAYTKRGKKIVEENKGALWSSPEFFIGNIYDRKEKDKLIGTAQMFAVALTGRPMQSVDTLDAVKLNMLENKEGVNVENEEMLEQLEEQNEEMELSPEDLLKTKEALIIELEEKIASLEAELLASSERALNEEEEIPKPDDAPEGPKDEEEEDSEELNKRSLDLSELTNLRALVPTLTKRAEDAEEKLVEITMEKEVGLLIARGFIANHEKDEAYAAYKIKDSTQIFWNRFSSREKPIVDLKEIGHSVEIKPEEEKKVDTNTLVHNYCDENNLDPRTSWMFALKEVEKTLSNKEQENK